MFTVGGFGFSGQGQNNGLAFISLKPWSERVGEENSVTAIIQRAMIALSSINKAVVFPFNLPAVAELGTASGFDMELLDNGNLGHEKLTQARNELLSLAAQSPNQVIGVRPNGLEDTPMFKVNVNAAKAEAMGVALSDINQTISTAFGSSYVNDFLNQGRVKKCMSRQARRSVCCRITSTNGMYATPLARWHRFLPIRLPNGPMVHRDWNATTASRQWRF